jgi:hypothetical protein
MSYIRWTRSFWYVYWFNDIKCKNKYEQTVVVHPSNSNMYTYTYFELIDDFETCIASLQNDLKLDINLINELRIYLNNFIFDVHKQCDKLD